MLVLQRGATSEIASSLSQSDVRQLQSIVGAAVSPELVTVVRLRTDDAAGEVSLVPLRGVGPQATHLRPDISIVSGRSFVPGRHEVIVGRLLAQEYSSLRPGGQIKLREHPWPIVGVFSSSGDIHESEVRTDLATLAGELGKQSVSSVTVQPSGTVPSDTALEALLAAHAQLAVTVQDESTYYANQSKNLRTMLLYISYGIGIVMAFGACFGALNAMYSSVEARRAEFGTLRAIGARPASLMASILLESMLLSGIGALLGVVGSWLLFDGKTFSTLGESAHLTQLVIETRVPLSAALLCVGCACIIGIAAGLAPAVRALSIDPVAALQAT